MTSDKILNLDKAIQVRNNWGEGGLKVVFTNGCFDILHLGHVDYLEKAANLGDKLIVGLNTDASIRRIKGMNRPICDQLSRSRVLASLAFVDMVVLFDEPTPIQLIHAIKPDILTKGDDYTIENIVGADFVKKNGGNVITVPLIHGYSTTAVINKIIQLNR